MGLSWAEHTVEIAAPVEIAFAAIVDYESFPEWQNAVDKVDVIDRDAEGLGRTVRLYVDAKVRKIDYVLRYGYEPPNRIVWDFVEGNGMRDADGDYTLEALGSGRTRATYRFAADPQIPAPGVIIRRTHKQLVKRSVEDLKREAERRAAAAPAPGPGVAEEPAAAVPEEPRAPEAEAGPAPSPASGGGAAREDWVPLGARRADGPAPRRRTGRDAFLPPADPGELAARATSAAGRALRLGRGVARGALRAGLDVGRSVADRIDRALRGDDRSTR